MSLICGIDEAGRGPIIGPLVMGCVVLDRAGNKKLRQLRVRDSKKISPIRREALYPEIEKIAVEWKTMKIKPSDIDFLRKKISLNAIEAMKIAEIILGLESKPETVIVDAADAIAENFKIRIEEYLKKSDPDFKIPKIISEHGADDRYIEVGAASIMAKVDRDRAIDSYKGEYGDFGSGYPSDELTMKFIRRWVREEKLPEFVRRSWNTLDKAKQTRLGEY